MTNTVLLEEKIKGLGLKKNYIAGVLKITPYALSLKIRNENEFKASEIDTLSKMLGIDTYEEQKAIFFAN